LGAVGPERFYRVVGRWQGGFFFLLPLLVTSLVLASIANSSDVALYHRYANEALATPLLHRLPNEYPALSLVVFLVPKALPLAYWLGFGLLAAAACVALVLSSDGLERYPGWSRRTCIYLFLGTLSVLLTRYDVVPVLAAVLAVEGARRRRWGRAWAWATLGGLLKLFPFLLLPGFLITERAQTGKWAVRRALAASGPVVLVATAQTLLAPGSAVSPFRFETRRGFELSSLQGSLTLLTDPLHLRWLGAFGSIEVVGQGRFLISAFVTAAAVLALAALWWLTAQGKLSVEAVSLSVLSVGVLGDKAFAPQYLIWLVPLWAYWPLRRGWVAAAALTTLVYPVLHTNHGPFGQHSFYLATVAGALRNTVLLAASALWLIGQLKAARLDGSEERTVSGPAATGSAYGRRWGINERARAARSSSALVHMLICGTRRLFRWRPASWTWAPCLPRAFPRSAGSDGLAQVKKPEPTSLTIGGTP
jgi:hypothetical protein